MTNTKVSFTETLAIKVGRFLKKEYPNIDFADTNGLSIPQLTESRAIGFLAAGSAPQLNRWQKFFRDSRRQFMGVLWFSNKARGATHNKWTLEVYGDQNVELMTEVAEKLSNKFDTSVHLKLISEEPRHEAFL